MALKTRDVLFIGFRSCTESIQAIWVVNPKVEIQVPSSQFNAAEPAAVLSLGPLDKPVLLQIHVSRRNINCEIFAAVEKDFFYL